MNLGEMVLHISQNPRAAASLSDPVQCPIQDIMADKEQQMIKQVYLNLIIYLFTSVSLLCFGLFV